MHLELLVPDEPHSAGEALELDGVVQFSDRYDVQSKQVTKRQVSHKKLLITKPVSFKKS